MDMRRRVFVALAFVAAAACKHSTAASGDEWNRWSDRMACQVARWDGASLPAPDGPTVQTPDGLSFRLGRNFKKRNDFGCWDAGTEGWPGSGWRDVCVSRIVPDQELGPAFRLRPEPIDPNMADQHQSENWEAGIVTFDGRRAVVERARVSGGIEGARRERRTVIMIELRPSGWAELEGRAGDNIGYAELLGIARTIESPGARP
jgi:hypothetical protein